MTLLDMTMPAKSQPKTTNKIAAVSPDNEYGKARAWLDAAVARAQNGVVVEAVTLTPALAEVLLNRNPDNRPIRPAAVDQMARDITNGTWQFNGEPIIVSDDGLLNDGQHRCAAVKECGTAVRTVIVVGVPREARLTTDQGRARTVGDFLGMEGLKDGAGLAAAAGCLWQYETFGLVKSQSKAGQSQRATKGEIRTVVEKNPDLAKSLAVVPKQNASLVGGRSLLAFCHYVFAKAAGKAAATNFIITLVNGERLAKGDPILYARNRLVTERGTLQSGHKVELIFRAWNAHRKGESRVRLEIHGRALPKVER
jgi:hypothetical protein